MATDANSGLLDLDTGRFTSFAGADAVVTFEGAHIANIQSITINTTREIAPLYVLGSADPKSFNRNKRAIAGSMVMLNFDRSMLIDTLKNRAMNATYRYKMQQGMWTAAGNVTKGYTTRDSNAVDYITQLMSVNNKATGDTTAKVDAFWALNSNIQEFQMLVQNQLAETGSPFRRAPYVYEDQLPHFDVCIMFANPDGATAHMNIRGCMIMNTAMGISIDDALSEKAMTFVAMRLEDLQPGIHDSGESKVTDPPMELTPENFSSVDEYSKYWPTQTQILNTIDANIMQDYYSNSTTMG